jgi:uncharacterized protein (TIGR03085 family)
VTRSVFVNRIAQSERQALCDTALAVGAKAPTLCEGWAVSDLLAHLVLRETRPDLAAGMMVPLLAGRLQRAQDKLAGHYFPKLVERVRSGPPSWTPAAVPQVDELMNRMEFFVHHEDILRAQPQWTARQFDEQTQRALWAGLTRMSGLLFRRSPVGVVLVADGVGRRIARPPTALGNVAVRGGVAEVILWAFGRTEVATVKLVGPTPAVAALEKATRGV